jgi:hypothetical protein
MLNPYRRLHFDETRQNPDATAFAVQWQHGKLKLLYPDAYADASATPIWPYPQQDYTAVDERHGPNSATRRAKRVFDRVGLCADRTRAQRHLRHHARHQFRLGCAADGGDVHQLLALGDCGVSPYLSPLISVPVLFVIGYGIQSSFIAPLLARDKAREPMSALLSTLGLAHVLENLALLFFHADFKTVRIPISRGTFKFAGLIVSEPSYAGIWVTTID